MFCFSCSENGAKQKGSMEETNQAGEYLVFQVDPDRVDAFIELDHEVWTGYMEQFPAFISKDVWINESKPGEVSFIIYWNSYDEWKSIPVEDLIEKEKEFDEIFGAENYELVGEYHKENRWYKVSEYRK